LNHLKTSRASSLEVPYVKASGCGNTFLLVERKYTDDRSRARLTVRLCKELDADGVEWTAVSQTPDADVDALLVNADGSEAEISGNGTRCVAAHWVAEVNADIAVVRVRTGAGVKDCNLISRRGSAFEFEMNMGRPVIEGEVELSLPSGKRRGTKLSIGNPQFVVFVDDFSLEWKNLGAEIQAQKIFTQGTNVDFVRVVTAAEIEARFFERGVGETQSSGTGSCASAVAAIAAGKVKSPVRVKAVGGTQTVLWDKDVVLRGPALLESSGIFAL
jgi:diaminopimelate epimerase